MAYMRGLVPSMAVMLLVPALLKAAPQNKVSAVIPLQTELLAPLDLSRIHVGSPLLVRVDLQWEGSNCTLRAGSIVQGHVVSLVKRLKGVKNSEIEVSFEAADCQAHHEDSFPFTLVALVGPLGGASGIGQSGVTEAPPLADAIGNVFGGASGLRSAGSASAIISTFSLPIRTLPSHILPGQVVDIRKTTLSVGAGTDGATVITALGHDLRLEQGTNFILTRSVRDNPSAKVASKPVGSAESPKSIPIAPPEVLDESEICSGTCNVVDGSKPDTEVRESSAVANLSLKLLGYLPHENREFQSFDNETTLTYLDATNLLCTFDPHRLRERLGPGEDAVKNVRAVLIDPQSHSVKRVMEWKVRGDEQYLWRLPEGRVLVHMGHELRLFDTELKPLRSIRIEGQIAWVVSSPAGDHLAVGTVRERYSVAVHQALERVLTTTPEEDIDVHVFDKNFGLVLNAVQSSKMPTPVLSDSGELRLHGDGHTHWKITEFHWNLTEQTIASLKSACRPLLSTPEHGLIFAVGCNTSGGRWYRMLRKDGHPLLKGESPSNEIQQSAEGSIDGAFAVRIVKTVLPMTYDQPFKRSDLLQQKISIYRSSDGKRLGSVNTTDFALSQMGFALSPSGDQLALVGSSSITFYAINLAHN